MATRLKRVNAISIDRLLTRNLLVSPGLIGAKHSFQFGDRAVDIELPNVDLPDLAAIPAMHLQAERHNLAIVSWKRGYGPESATSIAVERATVKVEVGGKLEISNAMLEKPPNRPNGLDDAQIAKLNSIVKTNRDLAGRAFGYWLRVMRWVSKDSSIGRPQVRGAASGWSTYLADKKSKKEFWSGPHELTAVVKEPVSEEMWAHASKVLRQSVQPPLHYELYFDGIENRKLEDYQRAVVDFAVSTEVFIRTRTMNSLPQGLSQSLREYIDDASIRNVMTKFFKDLFSSSGLQTFNGIESSLHQLFDVRNEILHSGRFEGLTESQIARFQEATRDLIYLDDQPNAWL
jgi:hypothetical protein